MLIVCLTENGTLSSFSDSPPSQVPSSSSSSPSSVSISPELGHEHGILPSSDGIEQYHMISA